MTIKHNKTFYLNNGKTINSLKGLAKELRTISKDTFNHHVNIAKNDFANWVKHSMKNDGLSKNIEKKIDKIEIELEILRHLVHDEIKTIKKKVIKKVVSHRVIAKKPIVKKPVVKKPVVKNKIMTRKKIVKKALSKKKAVRKTKSKK